MESVQLDPNKGTVSARITVGQGYLGKFVIFLLEPNKTDFREITRSSTPPSRQTEPIGAPADLNGRFLVWDAVIVAVAVGDPFAVTLEVVQDGKVLRSFPDSGPSAGGDPFPIHGAIELNV